MTVDLLWNVITRHTLLTKYTAIPYSYAFAILLQAKWPNLVFLNIKFFTFGPRATGMQHSLCPQNVAAIALDRRFLGTIIAIFKMWLCPF